LRLPEETSAIVNDLSPSVRCVRGKEVFFDKFSHYVAWQAIEKVAERFRQEIFERTSVAVLAVRE